MYPCTDTLTQDILKAINGEYSAIFCYAQLAASAPTEEGKKQILEIRQDEINHYQTFYQIYTAITGTRPIPQITETCPLNHKDGLESAIKDEQTTVYFYSGIADKTQDPYIKKKFKKLLQTNKITLFGSYTTLQKFAVEANKQATLLKSYRQFSQ